MKAARDSKNGKSPNKRASEQSPSEDARVIRSKETVLKVTWELLSENGLSGVSIDEVSRRSGVAKTTIYRHWATRSDLLIDACSQIEAKQESPRTGSIKGDVLALLKDLGQMLTHARWSFVLPSVIDAAERDPSIAELHGKLQRAHMATLREVIDGAIKSGDLPRNTDSSTLIAALVGPLFYRRWFSREPLSDKFIKSIVDQVMDAP